MKVAFFQSFIPQTNNKYTLKTAESSISLQKAVSASMVWFLFRHGNIQLPQVLLFQHKERGDT